MAGTDPTPVTDEVADVLKNHGVDDDTIDKIKAMGGTTVARLAQLEAGDLVGDKVGMPVLEARELVAKLTPVTMADATGFAFGNFDVLPNTMEETAWLKALQAGGVSKVDQSTVISAIRAALAARVGLYDIPARLAAKMEAFAEDNDEQAPPDYFEMVQQLTRVNYAELFKAIPGLTGNYVTAARKKKLLDRVDQGLWPALGNFNVQLQAWSDVWNQGGQNNLLLAAVVGARGGPGAMMPSIQPPDTSGLRAEAEAVNDAINSVFRGTGVQIAAALAYEASEIRQSLDNPRLPGMIGVANREAMLKALGANVSATYPRMEQSVTRFVLSVMQVGNLSAGMEEIEFFSALCALGGTIPWGQLGVSGSGNTKMTGVGGGRL